MPVKHISYIRLPADRDEMVRKIFAEGTKKIAEELRKHYHDPPDEVKIDDVFSKGLEIIAETVSTVAAIPDFHCNDMTDRRVSFLPGYMKMDSQRLAYKVNHNNTQIASDIVYSISKDSLAPERINGLSNQALLYHYLLFFHEDNQTFLNGGTHQYLIANELISDDKYLVDVLQITSLGSKAYKKFPSEENTFLKIDVDFKKQDTVEKLYNHLDAKLNKSGLSYRWPYNLSDPEKLEKSKEDTTYKMRGYLIALWFKLLHDKNLMNIEQWFDDCISLAKESAFIDLIKRIEDLRVDFKKNTAEQYQFWYSLRFNSLPNLTVLNSDISETIGSAMLMTNFQLHPSYFSYIKRWIYRIYGYMRNLEYLKEIKKETVQEITDALNQDNPYYPIKVTGDRWVTSSQKHDLPLVNYYFDFFSTQKQIKHSEPYDEGVEILNNLSLMFWIEEFCKLDPLRKTSSIDRISTKCQQNFGTVNSEKEYGSLLGTLDGVDKFPTRIHFSYRLCGRFATLGCYLFLGYTMRRIHAVLTYGDFVDTYSIETAFFGLRLSFFIEGLKGKKDDDLQRNLSIGNICHNISQYEKQRLNLWWKSLVLFIEDAAKGEADLITFIKEKIANSTIQEL